jgi:hypothetical protein
VAIAHTTRGRGRGGHEQAGDIGWFADSRRALLVRSESNVVPRLRDDVLEGELGGVAHVIDQVGGLASSGAKVVPGALNRKATLEPRLVRDVNDVAGYVLRI